MSEPWVIAAYGFYWGPDRSGYLDLLRAGLYTEEEAKDQERMRPETDKALPLSTAIARVYGLPLKANPEILRALFELLPRKCLSDCHRTPGHEGLCCTGRE